MTKEKIEKEIIIEFSKMVIKHSDSLLKLSSGLAIVNLLTIVVINKTGVNHFLLAVAVLSFAAALVSVTSGYLVNSTIISKLSDYARGRDWSPPAQAEIFTAIQIIGLVVSFIGLLVVVTLNHDLLDTILRSSVLSGEKEH